MLCCRSIVLCFLPDAQRLRCAGRSHELGCHEQGMQRRLNLAADEPCDTTGHCGHPGHPVRGQEGRGQEGGRGRGQGRGRGRRFGSGDREAVNKDAVSGVQVTGSSEQVWVLVNMHIHNLIHIRSRTCRHTGIHVHAHAHVYTYMYKYTYSNTCVYTYAYTYAHTQTYMHTRTHACTNACRQKRIYTRTPTSSSARTSSRTGARTRTLFCLTQPLIFRGRCQSEHPASGCIT